MKNKKMKKKKNNKIYYKNKNKKGTKKNKNKKRLRCKALCGDKLLCERHRVAHTGI